MGTATSSPPSKRRTDGGEDDRADFISDLPDEVLGTIVSLLPTKNGCRTQALSRRWRPIWLSAPLNLEADRGFSEQVISKILSGHLGPARRILLTRIRRFPCRHQTDDDGRSNGWLTPRDLANLQELELVHRFDCRRNSLPPSVFRLAPALRVARFGLCHLPPNLAVDFPHLKQLTLHMVTFTQETLTGMLYGCPALESLLLDQNAGVPRLCISSPTLRSIGFCALWYKEVVAGVVNVQEMVIEDAPCLERLLPLNPDYGPATIRVIWAPKLKILGSLSKGTLQLHLRTTVFQKMTAVSLTTRMRTVKVLVLDDFSHGLDQALDFLKCFPCLERLYVTLEIWRKMDNVRKYGSQDYPTECLDLHLKKVALKVYYGEGPEVDFARFFILNAKVLEKMEFGLVGGHDDKWWDNKYRQLQVEYRASRNARIEFKRFSTDAFQDNKKLTHDLSLADPFDISFLDGYVTI
uniref:Uncharacterized protein n=1 Tax=Avena sativa TaxID=4498 RepID=A0ACD5VM61_AVESA